jgi:hypothetical protein
MLGLFQTLNVDHGIRLDFSAAARKIWRDALTAQDGGTYLTEAAPKTPPGSISPNRGRERAKNQHHQLRRRKL